MVRSRKQLEIANFTLTFGSEKVLLDFAEEIVIPAFLSEYRRNYRSGSYFFLDTELVDLGDSPENPLLCLTGKFVKDTVLRRDQRYDEDLNEIIEDEKFLQSSPTALFVLILNNHRLLYLKETSFAPPLDSFQATVRTFLFQRYHEVVSNLRNSYTSSEELEREYPPPDLRIINLSNTSNLRDFIDRYAILKSIEVRLYPRNSNLDNDNFFDSMASKRRSINSSVTVFRHENNSDGLNKNEAVDQLEEVSSQANHRLKMRGNDHSGNKLTGTNDDIKIEISVENIPDDIIEAANYLKETYDGLVENGTILAENLIEDVSQKIKHIRDTFLL